MALLLLLSAGVLKALGYASALDPTHAYNPDLFWDASELASMVAPGLPAILRR